MSVLALVGVEVISADDGGGTSKAARAAQANRLVMIIIALHSTSALPPGVLEAGS